MLMDFFSGNFAVLCVFFGRCLINFFSTASKEFLVVDLEFLLRMLVLNLDCDHWVGLTCYSDLNVDLVSIVY